MNTKRFFIICILTLFSSLGAQAQLRVESNGHVGVGGGVTQNPFYIYSLLGAECQVARTEIRYPKTIAYVVKLRERKVVLGVTKDVVNDNYYIEGDGTVYASKYDYTYSDSTLKKDILTIPDPITKLASLRGIAFHWRPTTVSHTIDSFSEVPHEDSMYVDSTGADSSFISMDSLMVVDSSGIGDTLQHYGFIAQEVKEAFPGHGMTKLAPNGVNAVAYTEVIPLLVESVKAQQEQIANLNEESPNIASMGEQLEAQAALIASLQHKDSLRCTQIYNLNTTLSSHTSAINTLNTNYTTQAGYVTSLQSTVASHTTSLSNAASDITALQSAVTALQADSAFQAAQIAALASANSALATRTTTLESANSTKSAQITSLQSDVSALQTSLTALQNLVATLQARLDICCPE